VETTSKSGQKAIATENVPASQKAPAKVTTTNQSSTATQQVHASHLSKKPLHLFPFNSDYGATNEQSKKTHKFVPFSTRPTVTKDVHASHKATSTTKSIPASMRSIGTQDGPAGQKVKGVSKPIPSNTRSVGIQDGPVSEKNQDSATAISPTPSQRSTGTKHVPASQKSTSTAHTMSGNTRSIGTQLFANTFPFAPNRYKKETDHTSQKPKKTAKSKSTFKPKKATDTPHLLLKKPVFANHPQKSTPNVFPHPLPKKPVSR